MSLEGSRSTWRETHADRGYIYIYTGVCVWMIKKNNNKRKKVCKYQQ